MFGRILIVAIAGLIIWSVVARASSGAGPERVYVVKPHDTLWLIASSETSIRDPREGVWRIERLNHLADATIVPGEKLVLPG